MRKHSLTCFLGLDQQKRCRAFAGHSKLAPGPRSVPWGPFEARRGEGARPHLGWRSFKGTPPRKGLEGCFNIKNLKLLRAVSFLFLVNMLPGGPGGVSRRPPRGIPRGGGAVRRLIFMIWGLGSRDPQVPTWRGSRPGYEVPPGDPPSNPPVWGVLGGPGGILGES